MVVVYNATPHASRGFSPHYLIFGREPFLCIYFLLAFNVANDEFNYYVDACNVNIDSVNVDEWFQSHLTRLREAHVRVDDQRKKQADTRKERRDNRNPYRFKWSRWWKKESTPCR